MVALNTTLCALAAPRPGCRTWMCKGVEAMSAPQISGGRERPQEGTVEQMQRTSRCAIETPRAKSNYSAKAHLACGARHEAPSTSLCNDPIGGCTRLGKPRLASVLGAGHTTSCRPAQNTSRLPLGPRQTRFVYRMPMLWQWSGSTSIPRHASDIVNLSPDLPCLPSQHAAEIQHRRYHRSPLS